MHSREANQCEEAGRARVERLASRFDGAIVAVSHDRYLIESCADQLWVVADHAVANFDGDLDDYRRLVLSSRNGRTPPREAAEPAIVRDKPARTERPKPVRQRITQAEAEIERITAIIAKIDAALALPDIFSRDLQKKYVTTFPGCFTTCYSDNETHDSKTHRDRRA